MPHFSAGRFWVTCGSQRPYTLTQLVYREAAARDVHWVRPTKMRNQGPLSATAFQIPDGAGLPLLQGVPPPGTGILALLWKLRLPGDCKSVKGPKCGCPEATFRGIDFKLFFKQDSERTFDPLPLFCPRYSEEPASGRRLQAPPEPDTSSAWGTEGTRQGPVS